MNIRHYAHFQYVSEPIQIHVQLLSMIPSKLTVQMNNAVAYRYYQHFQTELDLEQFSVST